MPKPSSPTIALNQRLQIRRRSITISSRIRLPSLLLLAAVSVTTHALSETDSGTPADRGIAVQVVDEAHWRDDVTGAWWDALVHPTGIVGVVPGPLIVPRGSHAIPIPDEDGLIDFAEWDRFLTSPLLPHKNAVRLLGAPDYARATPAGTIEVHWGRAVLANVPTPRGPRCAAATLTITPPMTFRWEYLPFQQVRARPKQ